MPPPRFVAIRLRIGLEAGILFFPRRDVLFERFLYDLEFLLRRYTVWRVASVRSNCWILWNREPDLGCSRWLGCRGFADCQR